MASHNEPSKPAAGGRSHAPSGGTNVPPGGPTTPSVSDTAEALRPFQEAAAKFLQAQVSANESFFRLRAQFALDLQDEARKVEQEAHQAVMEATRKHLGNLGQPATGQSAAGSVEAQYGARTQAQLDYERAVQQIYADTQAKMMAIAQKAQGENISGDSIRRFTEQRQGAYQAYLEDLQRAWAATRTSDPQTLNAIAASILMTMNAVG